MKYVVEVQRGDYPKKFAFGAVVPELPGCFTVGNTLDELQENLKEAVTLWIEAAQDDGDLSHPMPTGFILQIEVPA